MIVRFPLRQRFIVFSLIFGFILTIFLFLLCFHLWDPPTSSTTTSICPRNDLHRITCIIDGTQRVPCVHQIGQPQQELFVPFNKYLKKQFDLTGNFYKNHFDLLTSYSRIRSPSWSHYDPIGPFEEFNNVALRQRVRCVDPSTGVPMSTQWGTVPYFYPIQILQFGLEHYNKNRTVKSPIFRSLAKKVVRKNHNTGRKIDENEEVMELQDGESVHFELFPQLPILLFSLRMHSSKAQFVIESEVKRNAMVLQLIYKHSEEEGCLWMETRGMISKSVVMYSLGSTPSSNFVHFVLDIPVHTAKALALICERWNNDPTDEAEMMELCKTENGGTNEFLPKSLSIHGPCELRVDALRQQSSAHSEMFIQVARWLLANQDSTGGWPVPVQRTIIEDRHQLVLSVGWHSAMAQGHALSFLTRAHAIMPDDARFLAAAERALALFEVPSSNNGVLNHLFGHSWFEEYPTVPGTFVLNGMMYALLGLHDFGSLHNNMSRSLFQLGVRSLRTLLPLFDTGQRSLYDLRHVHLASRPNMARWDYHSVHVFQLVWMHSITDDPLFKEYAERWADYARGKAPKHN